MDLAAKTGANEVVVIFDMDNFNIRPYTWRPGNFFRSIHSQKKYN